MSYLALVSIFTNEQLTVEKLFKPAPAIITGIPPSDEPLLGMVLFNFTHSASKRGSEGSRHLSQKSLTLPPFGTPSQSRQVELSPPFLTHSPHTSCPNVTALPAVPPTQKPHLLMTALPEHVPVQSVRFLNAFLR